MRAAHCGIVRPDHDPVRFGEVANGRALAQELGIRRVRDVVQAACIERVSQRPPRAGRNGRLHDQGRSGGARRQRVEHRLHAVEIRIARCRGRRVDAHERDARAVEQLGGVVGEVQAREVPPDELGQSRLVQRDLAARELREPLAVDVEPDHVVAEVGEGGGGHEADPPDADHAEGLAPASAHFGGTGCRLRAIATIVLFVRLSPSVLSSQTTYWRLGP